MTDNQDRIVFLILSVLILALIFCGVPWLLAE